MSLAQVNLQSMILAMIDNRKIFMARPAARLLLVLAACTAACGARAAASGNMPKAGQDEHPAPTKEVCVDTEDLELIKVRCRPARAGGGRGRRRVCVAGV